MSEFFECLVCGAVSPVVRRPLKCAYCGHGAGVVISRAPGSAAEERKEPDGYSLAQPDSATTQLSASPGITRNPER